MNLLINYLGTDGAGRLIAFSLAKSFTNNGNGVFAVLSSGLPGNDAWVDLLGKERVYFVDNYKNRNKWDFATKTIRMKFVEGKKIRQYFGNVSIDCTIRTMYHHWAHLVDKALSAKKVVTICHNPVMHSDEKKYFRKLYRKHILESDKIIVLTKSYAKLVENEYCFTPSDILYVPLGRIDEYTKYPSKPIKQPYSEMDTNFLFFGLLRKYKGLHVLARAYSIVSSQCENVTLHVVGSGDLSEYADEFGKCKNVFFDNRYIGDDEVSGYFSGPNVVVVLPYIDASQSGIIQVALEYENTVIASNTDALREQLDDGYAGLFFEPGNAEELAVRMMDVVHDKTISAKQAGLMRDLRNKLDWNVIGKQIQTFLE